MSINNKVLDEQKTPNIKLHLKNKRNRNNISECNINFSNESINLNQVNQKIKLEKQKFNSFHNKLKNNAEELLVQAFDLEEDFPLPENYIIDELNEESINFLKKAKEEEKLVELKIIRKQRVEGYKQNQNSSLIHLSDQGNKFYDTQIFQKEEIIFNINVNNRSIFEKNYTDFKISSDWRKIILHEFTYLNNFFTEAKNKKNNYSLDTLIIAEEQKDYFTHLHLSNLIKSDKQILTHDDIIKEFKLQKENINFVKAPASDNMSVFLALKINNKNSIRLIKHLGKNLHETHNIYNILMWIYMLLSFLQLPLVDEDNSVLYGLNKIVKKFVVMSIDIENKKIYDNSEQDGNNYDGFQVSESLNNNYEHQVNYDLIAAKIIYIIISEFFNQRII